MAAEMQFLDIEGLSTFKSLMTTYIDDADALSIKSVALSSDGKSLLFYKVEPADDAEPAYSVELNLEDMMKLVTSAIEDDIAVFDANGQVIDSETKISDLATNAYVGVIPAGYEATTIAEYAKELADNVAAHGYDDTELRTQVEANTSAIETLNGDEDTEGSVAKAIADATAELQAEIDKKADSATTLEGYGIEDAYTKDETDTAIAEAVADADHLRYKIVASVGDIDVNASDADRYIYLVPRTNASGEDTYDEYMVINGALERVGDWTVDLSDYVTKEYGEENYATAEQGAKADTAVQSVTSGSEDGTISVDGTDVEVTGLGSAAFTDSDAYDAAGAAAAVLGTDADTASDNTVYGAKAYADSLIDELPTYSAIPDSDIEALFN